MTLDCQILTSENLMERLVVFTATAGSDDAKQLELLAVIGMQEIHSAAQRAKSGVTAAGNGYG
jgi:hypothetical protein